MLTELKWHMFKLVGSSLSIIFEQHGTSFGTQIGDF